MALAENLSSTVTQIFKADWTVRNGASVPNAEDVNLGNDAVRLDGTVLYADLSDSTGLVDHYRPEFSAKIYKAYLHCAAKIIKDAGGTITAYDGDRVMAVFLGSLRNASAVLAALRLNYARQEIIMPALRARYPEVNYEVRHTVGVDTSPLFVAREGVRGANDLVWVGRAANYAAKLASRPPEVPTWITADVYAGIGADLRVHGGREIWQRQGGSPVGGTLVYGSTWMGKF